MNLLTNKDLIVFGEDFARHPHSLEHLLRPLFDNNRFIWVETIGLRSPRLSLYDFKKICLKIFRWFSSEKKISATSKKPESIHIVTPFMIPYNQFSLIRWFNKYSVLKSVQKKMIELNFKADFTIASVPNSCDYVGNFSEKKIIYVCVDEFSLWPGLDFNLVSKMESMLLKKSDLVFATSTNLLKSKSNQKTDTILLTHGVDFNHFKLPVKKINPEKIKICYFGLFDERSDQKIIQYIADHVENCEVFIIGSTTCNVSMLKAHPKIKFTGPVQYSELPAKISDMDIFILPYVKNELTNNINPLKLKEYLSTGRPVISTSLAEVLMLKNYLFIADSGIAFKNVIDQSRKNELSFDSEKIQRYILDTQTWVAKAGEFSKKLNEL